jgi:hypothetical protein
VRIITSAAAVLFGAAVSVVDMLAIWLHHLNQIGLFCLIFAAPERFFAAWRQVPAEYKSNLARPSRRREV